MMIAIWILVIAFAIAILATVFDYMRWYRRWPKGERYKGFWRE